MSPGIVEADPTIKEGDLVIIIEQAHGKAIAIGRALIEGKDMGRGKGKAIKSIHFVGDEIWKLEQK
jgi:PUA domain protein